jgi:hypothetical protein
MQLEVGQPGVIESLIAPGLPADSEVEARRSCGSAHAVGCYCLMRVRVIRRTFGSGAQRTVGRWSSRLAG